MRRFIEINSAMAASFAYITTRVKQWLRMANHDGRMPWFDALKRQENPQDLLEHLGALAASGVGESPATGTLSIGGRCCGVV